MTNELQIYIDGKYYPKSEAKISVYDHGSFTATAFLKESANTTASSSNSKSTLTAYTVQHMP